MEILFCVLFSLRYLVFFARHKIFLSDDARALRESEKNGKLLGRFLGLWSSAEEISWFFTQTELVTWLVVQPFWLYSSSSLLSRSIYNHMVLNTLRIDVKFDFSRDTRQVDRLCILRDWICFKVLLWFLKTVMKLD